MNAFFKKNKRTLFYFFFIFFCMFCLPYSAISTEKPKEQKPEKEQLDGNPLVLPIQFFRQYLSGADGDRCPTYPSCSRYALDAIKKHGGITGWIMTCDRLMRCGRDEVSHSPSIHIQQRFFVYDPVENNDFWWE
ncbi:MAG: membrane protein insertion efficiency factor YidD [Deltaproteobacteria bacterium]|nr:MAG: membrane protein insertion efficiency factor YidD [Deltaproteobacteria bacterium]